MIELLLAMVLAFALLFGVAVLTTALCKALDKGRRQPKDDTTWTDVQVLRR